MLGKFGVTVFVLTCIIWQVHGTANCTATGAGRYPDPDDTTCKNYTLCVYVSSSSSYLAYDYTCPTTSYFDPSSKLCTTSYVCTNTSSTSSTNTTDSVCTTDGYVANPNSTDCTTYIECVEINGTFTETVLTCPNDTYYNPNTTLCESDYNCTTTDTCTSAGRIANTSDTTCQTYYLCVENSDGTYTAYSYTCPSTSVFSPTISACTTSYTCTTT